MRNCKKSEARRSRAIWSDFPIALIRNWRWEDPELSGVIFLWLSVRKSKEKGGRRIGRFFGAIYWWFLLSIVRKRARRGLKRRAKGEEEGESQSERRGRGEGERETHRRVEDPRSFCFEVMVALSVCSTVSLPSSSRSSSFLFGGILQGAA